jgi:SEC-C motif domain protein
MRARYTAYTEGRGDFLTATLVEERRSSFDGDQAGRFGAQTVWLGLEIFERSAGGPEDERGFVSFEARLIYDGCEDRLRERSAFRRVDGRWMYVDGERLEVGRVAHKVGRNDSCPCGSGRKYKKCCGRQLDLP